MSSVPMGGNLKCAWCLAYQGEKFGIGYVTMCPPPLNHSLCLECFTDRRNEGLEGCPECHGEESPQARRLKKWSDRIVPKYDAPRTRCAFDRRCPPFTVLENLKKHEEEACPMRPVPCIDASCTQLIVFQEFMDHMNHAEGAGKWKGYADEEGQMKLSLNNDLRDSFYFYQPTKYIYVNDIPFFPVVIKVRHRYYAWVIAVEGRSVTYVYSARVNFMDRHFVGQVFPVDMTKSEILQHQEVFNIGDEEVFNAWPGRPSKLHLFFKIERLIPNQAGPL